MSELTALLQQAVTLHQQGRLEQARALYQQVLALAPRQFDALHLSGVIARQRGDPARAAELIRAALQVDASQARAHSNLGAALQDLGQPEAALDAYDSALRLDPRYALAWNNRGNALRRLGRVQEALDSYARALALQGAYPEAWCHRAIALNDLGRHDEAAASAEQALRARPDYAEALLALGNALQGLERFGEAVDACDRALAALSAAPGSPASPAAAETWCARGAALRKAGMPEQALDSYERALQLRPDYALAAHYRAHALRALGRREDAIAAYRHARALGADPAGIDFALAALGQGEPPSAAPAAYVKGLCDQYAGHFERHLVGVLGYRTPALLAGLLEPQVGTGLESALDLGCGTGLCAPFLRPLTRRLAGVDLSDKMLDKARATGLYDELACADILAWLDGRHAEWELVLAADVLVYFGDLAPLFARVAQATRAGGWLAFSVETLAPAPDRGGDDSGSAYAITASNRFAHAPAYVRASAAAAGFTLVEMQEAVLRKEHGLEVKGMLFLLRRPLLKSV